MLGRRQHKDAQVEAGRPDSDGIKLLYDEAVRARDLSAATLDELRSRIGTTVGVIALTTTFLGTLSASAKRGITGRPVDWAALGLFLFSALILTLLLNPIPGWEFWPDPQRVRTLITTRGMSTDEARLKRAEDIESNLDGDDKRLSWMQRFYTLALLGFVGEIVLFLIGILGPA